VPSEHRKVLKYFKFKRLIIPVLIGLGVAAIMVWRDFDRETFANINWGFYSTVWLLCAICLMAVRDVAYMYRIRLLTDFQLSWRRSFQVIMLWEFASSVTPSVVGGSAIALFILKKEGIAMGRTTAIVFITAMLDELFYIIMVPIVILLAGFNNLFMIEGNFLIFSSKFGSFGIFVLGYFLILILTSTIIYGIFINPRGFKWLLIKLSRWPILKRWKKFAAQTGDEIIATSQEMKGKSISFWLKAFGATFFSWTARFWVVNCLILVFTGAISNHFLVYARQLVMWVILLISPTPGSSGSAEYFFPLFLGDFIGGLSDVVALSWRLVSYYPYLFIGVLVLPVWLRRVYFGGRRSIKFRST